MHATHKSTGDEVAIKVFDRSLMDENARAHFKTEASILYKCKHHNVVKVIEVFETR